MHRHGAAALGKPLRHPGPCGRAQAAGSASHPTAPFSIQHTAPQLPSAKHLLPQHLPLSTHLHQQIVKLLQHQAPEGRACRAGGCTRLACRRQLVRSPHCAGAMLHTPKPSLARPSAVVPLAVTCNAGETSRQAAKEAAPGSGASSLLPWRRRASSTCAADRPARGSVP